jgi:hypothetical protein
LPIPFPAPEAERLAMLAAFVDRFFLGLVVGGLLGLGLSLPTAMITRSYAPVLAVGTLAGLGVGVAYELAF